MLGLNVYDLLVPFVETQPVDGSLVVEVHDRCTMTVIKWMSMNRVSAMPGDCRMIAYQIGMPPRCALKRALARLPTAASCYRLELVNYMLDDVVLCSAQRSRLKVEALQHSSTSLSDGAWFLLE